MARIAIVGSGVVGQATGKALSHQGHAVFFCDVDEQKISALRQAGFAAGQAEDLANEPFDIAFLCVPTPTVDGAVDLSFLHQACETVGRVLRDVRHYPIVVSKSTNPPGTVRRVIIPTLELFSGKKAGQDFGVAVEPEYLREKHALPDAEKPRLFLVGTEDKHAGHLLAWLRAPFGCPVEILQPEEAEMQKYVHNLFNAAKISFFNEMRTVCRKAGIDAEKIFPLVAETAEASWNRSYGVRDFGPFNGMCLPKDTTGFLTWARQQLGEDMPLLKAVIDVNERLIADQVTAPVALLPEGKQPSITDMFRFINDTARPQAGDASTSSL